MIKQPALSICAICAAICFASTTNAAAAPELAQLSYFNGTWNCTGKISAHDGKPERTTADTARVENALDGAWQQISVEEALSSDPKKTNHIVVYQGYDSQKKSFVSLELTSWGGYSVEYSNGWNGDTLIFESPAGNTSADRDTFVKSGPDAMAHTSESRDKDGVWKKYVEHVCQRVKTP